MQRIIDSGESYEDYEVHSDDSVNSVLEGSSHPLPPRQISAVSTTQPFWRNNSWLSKPSWSRMFHCRAQIEVQQIDSDTDDSSQLSLRAHSDDESNPRIHNRPFIALEKGPILARNGRFSPASIQRAVDLTDYRKRAKDRKNYRKSFSGAYHFSPPPSPTTSATQSSDKPAYDEETSSKCSSPHGSEISSQRTSQCYSSAHTSTSSQLVILPYDEDMFIDSSVVTAMMFHSPPAVDNSLTEDCWPANDRWAMEDCCCAMDEEEDHCQTDSTKSDTDHESGSASEELSDKEEQETSASSVSSHIEELTAEEIEISLHEIYLAKQGSTVSYRLKRPYFHVPKGFSSFVHNLLAG